MKRELLAVHMVSFAQLMLFERQKEALGKDCGTLILSQFYPQRQSINNTEMFQKETEAVELCKGLISQCFTWQQLMTVRYCLLAYRMELMYTYTKAPYRNLRDLLPSM